MRKLLAWSGIAVMTCLIGVVSVQAAEDSTTLSGTYVWENGNSTGDLEAVFTPTGEGTWDVAFHFTFRKKPHTYTGTAKGALDGGTLSGTVLNENKRRTFTFEGAFEEGVFNGTHAEMRGESKQDTGTLMLQ